MGSIGILAGFPEEYNLVKDLTCLKVPPVLQACGGTKTAIQWTAYLG